MKIYLFFIFHLKYLKFKTPCWPISTFPFVTRNTLDPNSTTVSPQEMEVFTGQQYFFSSI